MNILEEKLELKIAKSNKDIQACFDIRNQVFEKEHNLSHKIQSDNKEEIATHFLASLNGKPVGTARLYKIDNNSAKISRVAVLSKYRGKQIGKYLIDLIIKHSREQGISTLILASQSSVVGFYEGFGFKTEGDEYLDANIPHYKMYLEL